MDKKSLPASFNNPNGNGPATTDDLFSNLEDLRIPQDFAASLGVKKALLTIPVKKPSKEWWVRTNPDLRLQTYVIELKEDREVYIVSPKLWSGLAAESTFGPRLMCGAINRQNVFFIWPVRLPGSDGKIDDWNRSALEAANMAETRWVRVASNMSLGAYDVSEARADIPEPEWPDLPFNDLLRIAFKNRVIESFEDPTLKRLRGEV